MENSLKIIEWNVQSVAMSEKSKDKFEQLTNRIVEQKADIVVLTEVKGSQKDILRYLLENKECNYDFASTSNQTPNGVCIIVSADKIEKVLFQDIRTYKNKNYRKKAENKFYPDTLLMTAYLKCGKNICLMGTRFSTSKLNTEDKKAQIQSFQEIVKKYKPRIIIGDLNWDTVIKEYIENKNNKKSKEEQFCSDIMFRGKTKEQTKQAKFVIRPTSEEKVYSYTAKNGTGFSNPDRLIYDTNTFQINTIEYNPEINENNKIPNCWPSDHAMLICEMKIL